MHGVKQLLRQYYQQNFRLVEVLWHLDDRLQGLLQQLSAFEGGEVGPLLLLALQLLDGDFQLLQRSGWYTVKTWSSTCNTLCQQLSKVLDAFRLMA